MRLHPNFNLRSHRIQILFAACIVLCFAYNAEADPVFINFDNLAPGIVLTNQYAALGVTFSNSQGTLITQDATPGPPFTPPIAILPDFAFFANTNRADFTVAVNTVSVVLGDFDADEDILHLELYDATNHLLASNVQTLPATTNGGLTLLATTPNPNVAYALFYAQGAGGANSAYFDNFSFGVVIPEPSTVALLITGLAFMAIRLRKKA